MCVIISDKYPLVSDLLYCVFNSKILSLILYASTYPVNGDGGIMFFGLSVPVFCTCMHACVRACVRACMRACVRVHAHTEGTFSNQFAVDF